MNKEMSQPAMIAIVVAAIVIVIGLGWYLINRDNGHVAAYAGEHGVRAAAAVSTQAGQQPASSRMQGGLNQ